MSGELSLACTTGGLHQSTWKEQGTSPSPSKMLSVSFFISFNIILVIKIIIEKIYDGECTHVHVHV